jgi:hypothetical protein
MCLQFTLPSMPEEVNQRYCTNSPQNILIKNITLCNPTFLQIFLYSSYFIYARKFELITASELKVTLT